MSNGYMVPNILICGQTGVGKSSVVNFIFGDNIAGVGEDLEACTKGITLCRGKSINIYDSEGYEINKTREYENLLLEFLSQKSGPGPEAVHMVWYAISGAGKRYTDFDIKIVQIIEGMGSPICILLTKIDGFDDEKQMNGMYREIRQALPEQKIFRLSKITDGNVQKYCDWQGLKDWTLEEYKRVIKILKSLGEIGNDVKDEDGFNKQQEYVGGNLNKKRKGPIAKIWNDVQALWKYVLSDQVPWYKKVIPLAGLVYLVNPIDIVPDFIPIAGLLDDVFVISMIVLQMGSIIKGFNKRQGDNKLPVSIRAETGG
jgi:uncharacterized membrane protein YkvA (DUF1232 family)/GTP-binding protein EngB required for normal cell division